MPDMTPIVNVAISLLPGILDLIRDRARRTPATALEPVPVLDDAIVIAALVAAVGASIAKDDRWLAAHPEGA